MTSRHAAYLAQMREHLLAYVTLSGRVQHAEAAVLAQIRQDRVARPHVVGGRVESEAYDLRSALQGDPEFEQLVSQRAGALGRAQAYACAAAAEALCVLVDVLGKNANRDETGT